MGLIGNFINRKKVESHGKETRQILDEQSAILLSAGVSDANPDFADAFDDDPQPKNINIRMYDFGKTEGLQADLLDTRKKAFTTYQGIYVNDILIVDNQEYTVLKVDRNEDAGELVLWLK